MGEHPRGSYSDAPVTRSCERCEGDGSYSELAPCTTGGPDCACNGPRALVDPCDRCQGFGQFSRCSLCGGRGCWDCDAGWVAGP